MYYLFGREFESLQLHLRGRLYLSVSFFIQTNN